MPGHPQDGLLLVKGNEIGFLGPGPGGVSAAADAAFGRGQARQGLRPPDGDITGHKIGLGSDILPVGRIHKQHGKARFPCFPGRIEFGLKIDCSRFHHRFRPCFRITKYNGDTGLGLIPRARAGIGDNGNIRSLRMTAENILQIEFLRFPAAGEHQFYLTGRSPYGIIEYVGGITDRKLQFGRFSFRKNQGIGRYRNAP